MVVRMESLDISTCSTSLVDGLNTKQFEPRFLSLTVASEVFHQSLLLDIQPGLLCASERGLLARGVHVMTTHNIRGIYQ